MNSGSESDKFSLADFFLAETDDPLVPPPDYLKWRRDVAWATSLYEPSLGSAAEASCKLGSRPVINMASYGYLALMRHPKIIQAAKDALDQFGTGSCGSPILSGRTILHDKLESGLRLLTGKEGVLTYNSGFAGALGTVAGLLRKGDCAVLDERSHTSLVDGVRVSGARLAFFQHNDPHSLDAILTRESGKRRLVIVEGIYSMDGDMANLPALLEVAESHRVGMLVDEAHSILCCGPGGGGVVEHFGARERVGIQYGTFSKGFSSCGGFAAAAPEIVDYLRFYSNPYGFSCALPPATVAGLSAALEVMREEAWRRERLWDNASYFCQQLQGLGLDTGESDSYVVPIVIGDDRALLYELGHALRDRGLFVSPVDYPSVPLETLRFRASVTAGHSRESLDEALSIIADVIVPAMRSRGLLKGVQV